jgi:Recombination endonuclease VII
MKTCTRCGASKSLEEFARNSRYKSGRTAACKECLSANARNTYDPEYTRERHYLRQYGITIADYDRMLADQGGKCAICPTDSPGRHGRFHVDHCHETGKVRGLLCSNCNRGLGLFQDNAHYLMTASKYVATR